MTGTDRRPVSERSRPVPDGSWKPPPRGLPAPRSGPTTFPQHQSGRLPPQTCKGPPASRICFMSRRTERVSPLFAADLGGSGGGRAKPAIFGTRVLHGKEWARLVLGAGCTDGEGDPASALGPGFTATQRGRRPCPEPLAGGQSPGRRCGPRRRAFAAGTLPPVPARATMARRPPPKHSGPGRGDNAPTSETPSPAEGPAFFLAFGPFGEGVKCPACGCQQRRGAARPGRHQDEGQDGKQLGRASAGGRTRGRAGWAAWLAGGGHSRPG